MGRDNALPRSFFGASDRKRGIPRNNVVFVGVLSVIGAFLLTFQLAAEMLNFGAFIAFMGVNASSFVHLCRHRESKGIIGLLVSLIIPLLGFSICAVLWGSVSYSSMMLGGLWLVIGIAYGAVRTKGFRSELVNFDIPPDEA